MVQQQQRRGTAFHWVSDPTLNATPEKKLHNQTNPSIHNNAALDSVVNPKNFSLLSRVSPPTHHQQRTLHVSQKLGKSTVILHGKSAKLLVAQSVVFEETEAKQVLKSDPREERT